MSRLASGIAREVALFDADGNVVRTQTASTPIYTPAVEIVERLDGVEDEFPLSHTLEIPTRDGLVIGQVARWYQQQTPIRCVVRGANRHDLFLTPVVPRLVPNSREAMAGYSHRVRLFTGDPEPDVIDGVTNLLARYARQRLDLVDVIEETDPGVYLAVAGVGANGFTLTNDDGGGGDVWFEVPFPFPGQTVRAAAAFSASTFDPQGSSDELHIVLEARSAAGAVLASAQSGSVTGADNYGCTLTLPANTYALRWRLVSEAVSLAKSVTVTNPCLMVGTSTAPVGY